MAGKKGIIIIGSGGHGRVAASIAAKMEKWKQICFMDDNKSIKSSAGIEVIGSTEDIDKYIEDYNIFVAIGDNRIRERLQKKLETACADIPVLIHPSAVIAENIEIGAGTIIVAGAVVNYGTVIGKGCIINTAATIDHDNVIEDFVNISPGAHLGGTVVIGKNTWIGIGAVVSNNITILEGCIVGAGAAVVKDIIYCGTYKGVPARKDVKVKYQLQQKQTKNQMSI